MQHALHPVSLEKTAGCRLWIDGVGCWLLWNRPELVVGNGSPGEAGIFRYRIMSDLWTVHGTFHRREGQHSFHPIGPGKLNHNPFERETILRDQDEIQLGEMTTLSFQVPSPLSASSRVTITSGHRSCDHLDGVILLDQTCLLGPDAQCHVVCRDWSTRLVLFERERELWWRCVDTVFPPQKIHHREVIEIGDTRIRIEAVS